MYMQSLTLTLCIHVCVCVCVYVHACMCVYVCDKWSAIRSKKLEVQALHFFPSDHIIHAIKFTSSGYVGRKNLGGEKRKCHNTNHLAKTPTTTQS